MRSKETDFMQTSNIIMQSEQLLLKRDRIAMQIIERYQQFDEIILIGINERGRKVAQQFISAIDELGGGVNTRFIHAIVDKDEHSTSISESIPENSHLIIVDDVMNSGSTIFQLINKIQLDVMASVQVAVMVDREHKRFPIVAEFVGLSLSTSLNDYVEIKFDGNKMVEAVNQ